MVFALVAATPWARRAEADHLAVVFANALGARFDAGEFVSDFEAIGMASEEF